MKSDIRTIAIAALAAPLLINAITPEGMLAAPRRGVAQANPSAVGQVRLQHGTLQADEAERILLSTPTQTTLSKIRRQRPCGSKSI